MYDYEYMPQQLYTGTVRLAKIQLANWGTFHGICEPIIIEGSHLISGESGTGKSTILDAINAILTDPRVVRYNAAAKANRTHRDRTLETYVLGAWGSDKDEEKQKKVRYMRKPPCWSGVALTYESEDGRLSTLLLVATMSSGAQRCHKEYYFIPSDFKMESIRNFPQWGWRFDKLFENLPADAQSFKTYQEFKSCFMYQYGIHDDKALTLLHRAQSMKTLSDVNLFFRTYMLPEPKTYKTADELVAGFRNVREAYESVKTCSKKKGILDRIAENYEKQSQAEMQIKDKTALKDACRPWALEMCIRANQKWREKDEMEKKTHETQKEVADEKLKQLESQLRSLEQQYIDEGSGALSSLEQQLTDKMQNKSLKERNRAEFSRNLDTLSLDMPKTGEQFARIARQASSSIPDLNNSLNEKRREHREIIGKHQQSKEEVEKLKREVALLQSRPSSLMEPGLLRLRDGLARQMGLDPQNLP